MIVFHAGNAETILTHQVYASRESAEGAIRSVQTDCVGDESCERKRATNDKVPFNLKAANDQVTGAGQMYASEASRETKINRVNANGSSATIRALTA